MIWSTIYTLDGELSRALLVKFYLEKIIEARRDLVYSIFSDYENYEKILPSYFPSIRIRSVRGNVAVVEEHMNLGNHELIIMAKHVTESPVTHDVFVIGGDVKGSHIQQRFIKIPEGTKVLIDADFKLKGKMKISSLLGKDNLKQDYAKILDEFANVV